MRSREAFWYWLAGLIGGAIAIAWVLWAMPKAHAVEATRAQIKHDCRWDALKLCKKAIITGDEQVIIACMMMNKERLSQRCKQHTGG